MLLFFTFNTITQLAQLITLSTFADTVVINQGGKSELADAAVHTLLGLIYTKTRCEIFNYFGALGQEFRKDWQPPR